MDNSSKIILDLCGGTGAWSKPYKDAGYDVRLITLPDNDVRTYQQPDNVYGILAAPPCTMFSYARTQPKTDRDLKGGMEIVEACLRIVWQLQYQQVTKTAKHTRLKFWALENPYFGLLAHFIGRPAFIFDPFEFGDGYQKRTALWGNFKSPKKNVVAMSDEIKLKCKNNSYNGTKKFDNIRNTEIHPEMFGKLNRAARRAITPAGFAKAFYEANK